MLTDLKYALIAITLITAAFLALRWYLHRSPALARSPPAFSSAALVAHLQQCSDLVTVRAPISSVIEQQSSGWFGSAKALVAITLWLDVGCDLHQARVISSDASSRTLILSLPSPKVLALRMDIERTRVYDLQRSGLWHLIPGSSIERDLVNQAVQGAPSHAMDDSSIEALLGIGRDRAKTELQVIGATSGWTVTVEWQP